MEASGEMFLRRLDPAFINGNRSHYLLGAILDRSLWSLGSQDRGTEILSTRIVPSQLEELS